MKVLLDIRESKALFFMELLNNFSYVKVTPVTKDLLLQEIQTETDIVPAISEKEEKKPLFAETYGMWAGRDIDIKKIRKERRERRTKYYDNDTL
jgi:hypothetical protein